MGETLACMLGYVLMLNLSGDAVLTSDMATYSTAAAGPATQMNNAVVTPIASVIISIVMVIDLTKASAKAQGDNHLMLRLIAVTLFKAVFLVTIAQNAALLIDAMMEVADTLILGVAGLELDGGGEMFSEAQRLTEWAASFSNWRAVELVLAMIVMIIPWLLAVAVTVAVALITFLRFLELYILSAFVTLPRGLTPFNGHGLCCLLV